MNDLTKHISTDRQRIHQLIFFYSIIFLAVTLPFSIKANRYAIITLVINWLLEGNFRLKFKSLNRNWIFLSIACFYVLHLVALIYTDNIKEGFFQLEKKLPLVVITLVVITSQKLNQIQFKKILFCFFFSILLSSVICLGYAFHRNNYLETFHNPVWFYFSYNDLTEIIDIQPNYLAVYVSFSIFILFYFMTADWDRYRMPRKLTISFTILYLVFFLLLLAGRTPIAATILVLFCFSVYSFYKSNKLFKGLIILGISGMVLIGIIYNIPIVKERLWQTFGIDQKSVWISQMGDGKGGLPSVRLLKWESAWKIIKTNWLIGIGPGDVQDVLQVEYKRIGFDLAFNERYNPHNQFLQTWLGIGILGLVSFLGCFVSHIIMHKERNFLNLSFIALIFLCCITESMFERQLGITFFGLFSSLFAFHSYAEFSE